ncbi:MAG: hypothetical protein RQ741_01635 [Wenzhouxiangellaceae bacterium]|nr:hypothetical protein [Wenzhouxiangellaceae bacterium]
MKSLARDLSGLYDFLGRLPGPASLVWLMLGLLAGWWLYVPVHEMLHVAGCLLAGGEVSRLELAPLYGGDLLAGWLPFVVSGSDYAGQLIGFDTRGSDWIYQSCVLMPYILTIFPGFWFLQRLLHAVEPVSRARAIAVGGSMPVVAAPLISLTGDYYESGSILASGLLAARLERDPDLWRSDDLFRAIAQSDGAIGMGDAAIIGLGIILAMLLAGLTMITGSCLGRALNRTKSRRRSPHPETL